MNTFDTVVFPYIHAWAGISPAMDAVIVWYAIWLVYIIAAGLIVWAGWTHVVGATLRARLTREIVLTAAVSGAVSRIVVVGLRILFPRARPFEVLVLPHQLIAHATGGAFPSWHATFAFALAAAVFFYHRIAGIVFLVLAVCVSMSRVVAGVHWPSDIVGGAIVGIASAWFTRFVIVRFLKNSEE